MKIVLICLSSLGITMAVAQTVEQLENDLSWHFGSEKYGTKIVVAKKLQAIDPLNEKAVAYICRYYHDRKIDSVSIFFDGLIKKFPNNAQPLLLRASLLFLEYDYQQRDNYAHQQRRILAAAHEMDSLNQDVLYQLAQLYYRDFLYPLEKVTWGMGLKEDSTDSIRNKNGSLSKHSAFVHSADSALLYFNALWRHRKNRRDVVYYPIRQLECYLNSPHSSCMSKIYAETAQCFFPGEYFSNLRPDWASDFTVDYLYNIERAHEIAEQLKVQLIDLGEKCINNETSPSSIYRFTWLRSFNEPVSIRIENSAGKVELYWKVGKGKGGYTPRGLKKAGKKRLTDVAWAEFINLVNDAKFDSLPNLMYYPMHDGATWTLERRVDGKFKAFHTNVPPSKFRTACLFLLRNTKIRINEGDIY